MVKECTSCKGLREIRVGPLCTDCKHNAMRRDLARRNMDKGRRLSRAQRRAMQAHDGKERDEYGNEVGDNVVERTVW